MKMGKYQLDGEIAATRLTHMDLRLLAASEDNCRCYRIIAPSPALEQATAELVWWPYEGRAAFSCGGEPRFVDASSLEDAVRQFESTRGRRRFKMRTTMKIEGDAHRIIREDGEKILVEDVGRCWRVYFRGCVIDVSRSVSANPLATIRRWFARDELPIVDVHA